MAAKPRLVLVGGGHAHLEILRRWILSPERPAELHLISLAPRHHYSGMIPGYLQGTYREREVSFELRPLVTAAGGTFHERRAVGVDPKRGMVLLDGDGSVEYDLASFAVGSRLVGQDQPSVAQNATLIKPMSRAVHLRRRLAEVSRGPDTHPWRFVVVGAGAAGVEVALAIAGVLDKAGRRRVGTVVDASPTILSGYSQAFRQRAETVLSRKAMTLELGGAVVRVDPDAVELEGGRRLGSELTVWLTGPAASPIYRNSGLTLDERGFLLVDDTLRSVSHPNVFGVGDCVSLANHPDTPKAGVYAVREAPVLWRSLMAALGRGAWPSYRPQESFLSILNTGDGKALLSYKPLVSHSRWAWWIKDWIDRRFMRRYQGLVAETSITESPAEEGTR